MREKIHIYRPELAPDTKLSLATLERSPKVCVSGEGTHTAVYRLELDGRQYFLKIVKTERMSKLLPRLLAARRWLSSVELESLVLAELEKRGFETIPLVAAGSVYRWGVPVAGFMLSLSLPLPSLDERLKSDPERMDLWMAYGRLMAELIDSGCHEPLRAKDLLLDEIRGHLILLDREKPLSTKKINKKRKRLILERAIYRNERAGLGFSKENRSYFYETLDVKKAS